MRGPLRRQSSWPHDSASIDHRVSLEPDSDSRNCRSAHDGLGARTAARPHRCARTRWGDRTAPDADEGNLRDRLDAAGYTDVWRTPSVARLGCPAERRRIRPGTLRTAGSAQDRRVRQAASGKHQLGHVHGPPKCPWRALWHSNDAQRGAVDGPRLRFIELSRGRGSLRGRHHPRPSTTTRPLHGTRR